MNEYGFLKRILRDRYISNSAPDGIMVMEETKECQDHGVHRVKILKTKPVDNITLYRFSLDDEDFLPFFKDSRIYPEGRTEGGPEGLKKFCDYVILSESKERLTVILIEMKRAKKDTGYRDQLDASRIFLDYVIANAERIKDRNGQHGFNASNIEFRRVKIVHDPTCDKLSTKPRRKALTDGRHNCIILPLGKQFNPKWVI